jgi:cyclohexyl-isocyanide hydratase
MNRRDLGKLAGAASTIAALGQLGVHRVSAQETSATPSNAGTIGMLVFPGLTLMDLVGPQMYLAVAPGRTVQLLWKNRDTIVSDTGIPIQPTATFDEAPEDLEMLFIPGGLQGTDPVLEDPDVLDFVASRGPQAKLVTAVCTGSLILGAAGLLDGYRATSHWAYRDLLPLVGAEPVEARVVEDRNRITGGGVTSGLDFGLTVLARMAGEEYAQGWQLGTEYDPQPPFDSGTPDQADPMIMTEVMKVLEPRVEACRTALQHAPGYVGE